MTNLTGAFLGVMAMGYVLVAGLGTAWIFGSFLTWLL